MCGVPAIDLGGYEEMPPQQAIITSQAERTQLREVRNWQDATREELEANAPGLTVSPDSAAILIQEILGGGAASYY